MPQSFTVPPLDDGLIAARGKACPSARPEEKRENDTKILSFFDALVERRAPSLLDNLFKNSGSLTLLFSLLEQQTGGNYADFFTNGEVLADLTISAKSVHLYV